MSNIPRNINHNALQLWKNDVIAQMPYITGLPFLERLDYLYRMARRHRGIGNKTADATYLIVEDAIQGNHFPRF